MNIWNTFTQYDDSVCIVDDFGNVIEVQEGAHVRSFEFLARQSY